MTRDDAKKLLPIIQAFAEGKTIEIHERNGWIDMITENPAFDRGQSCYRIKPELKYRPFKGVEECWNEMQNHHPFGWIKRSGKYVNITLVSGESSYDGIFENATFADGTPFGIKEE